MVLSAPLAPSVPWERLVRLEVAVPTEEQPAHWALRVLAARLAQTALRERLVRPAPGAHWVLLEQLVVSVPRECLAQLELAVRMAQRERWGLRVSEVRWGPPVYQGRKEPLEQPVVSVRTARRERLAQLGASVPKE